MPDSQSWPNLPATRPTGLAAYSIPLPPLLEQRAIAETLDSVEPTIYPARSQTFVLHSAQGSMAEALLTDKIRAAGGGALALNLLKRLSGRVSPQDLPNGEYAAQIGNNILAADLPITLYLNKRVTFDLLASLQKGFSRFATVQTTSTEAAIRDGSAGGQLGTGNMLGFFSIQLGARRSYQQGQAATENVTEEIVHTPVSLFAGLRSELRSRGLVFDVAHPDDLNRIVPGSFVEFEAALRRSPMVVLLSAVSELLPLIELGKSDSGKQSSKASSKSNRTSGHQAGKQQNPTDTTKIISLLASMVSTDGSQDLIAELKDDMRFVLTVEDEYFNDPSLNDTIDGTFRVLGKVTQVVQDEHTQISLLRKTPLGRFGVVVDQLAGSMDGFSEMGFSGPIEIAIAGPTMQVIPIAIFA